MRLTFFFVNLIQPLEQHSVQNRRSRPLDRRGATTSRRGSSSSGGCAESCEI